MKNSILKTLTLGIAAGAISICGATAQAQMAPPAPGMAMPAMGMPAPGMDMMTPMPVSGTVLRYYVDRSGFVSAMDVQTADGVRMVHFSPSMAQMLTSTYPVGATASVYVTSMMMGKMTRMDLAGTSAMMPAPGSMMMPTMVSDLDLLKSQPYTTIGAKSMLYSGKITSFVADPKTGEVLAIVLDDKTLLRIPAENRQIQASTAPEGVVPLFAGSDVFSYGIPEAPRYGSVSPYAERVIATSISVNGRPLGPFGFGRLSTSKKDTLLGFNIPFFGGKTPEEATAAGMGMMTYNAPGSMPMAPAPMEGNMMMPPAPPAAPAM